MWQPCSADTGSGFAVYVHVYCLRQNSCRRRPLHLAIMIRLVTNKLKTQSLNEEHPYPYKAEDNHDSGTESDDEHSDTNDDTDFVEKNMDNELDMCGRMEKGRGNDSRGNSPEGATGRYTRAGDEPGPQPRRGKSQCQGKKDVHSGLGTSPCSNTASPLEPCFTDSAVPSDNDNYFDHHSSEEELEVINRNKDYVCRDSVTSTPEKRKWSEVNMLSSGDSYGSSDEEVQGLTCTVSTPVEFCTSPPLDVHRPGRSQSPPPKLFHLSSNGGDHVAFRSSAPPICMAVGGLEDTVSPRKRHRHTPRPPHIRRPCLDFEKMQQRKARAVTRWKHRELSLFCG